ncbi:hypothetical protein [Armatimonas sp.]|uniref:hypothetical protein n=1 Tax=Armatimonas sp. TaxID=1872638 RepID=UPI00286C4685|nr:hypothetical protein [Armatimonas sp.]
MSTITAVKPQNASLAREVTLRQGPFWPSFEQFRTQGNTALQAVTPGQVGTLVTKSGQYRILTESDFQSLYGLARDVERLRGGMRVVLATARAAQLHPDEATLEALTEAVMLMGDLPLLPTRSQFEPLKPEGLDLEDTDDDLDLENIPRPLVAEERR